jgi:hypothetical protein
MTKADILAKVERHELSTADALVLIEKLERMERAKCPLAPPPPVRRKPRFKVADNSGWCSVYFDGLRRPCTLPSALWLELLEDENLEAFKKFLEENKQRFRNKIASNGHA